MPTTETIKSRIVTVELLQSVVRTMKTLAAVSIRRQEKAIQTLAEYSRTIEMGLVILLRQGAGESIEQAAGRTADSAPLFSGRTRGCADDLTNRPSPSAGNGCGSWSRTIRGDTSYVSADAPALTLWNRARGWMPCTPRRYR